MTRSGRLGTLAARVAARIARARQEGWRRTAREFGARILILLVGALLIPVAAIAHLGGYRRVTFIVGRIGHLAIEPDSLLKAVALGDMRPRRWFFLAPYGAVANEHLLKYWGCRIPVVRNAFGCFLLEAMSAYGLMRFDAGRYVLWLDHSQEVYRINARWADRKPLIALTDEDDRWARQAIAALGVPPDRWFACIHAREPGFSPQDEATHAHRNGSIDALVPAMREIVARGGWCVRMGESTTRPLPAIAGVIDYAHHPSRSSRLDIVLCAKARLFVGNSSGLALVSSVFGVPCALANMVPLSALGVMPYDLSIPKLYRARNHGRFLPFEEIFRTQAANLRYAQQYVNAGIEVIENSADEILELVTEMLDRLEGSYRPKPGDEERQQAFKGLLREGDYGFGAASHIGADFLRRHAALLGD